MRLTRFIDSQAQVHHGIDRGDGTADVLAQSPVDGPLQPTGRTLTIHRRLAPIQPANIFCIGANYRLHVEESHVPMPEHPVVFMKPTTAVLDPGEPVVLPAFALRGPEVDYEAELAVVIGTPGRDIPEVDALRHVLGYTIANDISARRWQKHAGGGQWVRGKSFDTFCPFGPVLVTADEIPDPQKLRITMRLNGQVMQQASTADMIFSVANIISFLSRDTTLLPGTLILTGTPSGVGMARTPPVFLKDGDEAAVEIEGIGTLMNPVRAAAATSCC